MNKSYLILSARIHLLLCRLRLSTSPPLRICLPLPCPLPSRVSRLRCDPARRQRVRAARFYPHPFSGKRKGRSPSQSPSYRRGVRERRAWPKHPSLGDGAINIFHHRDCEPRDLPAACSVSWNTPAWQAGRPGRVYYAFCAPLLFVCIQISLTCWAYRVRNCSAWNLFKRDSKVSDVVYSSCS